jgi:hypothetical protein
VHRSLGVHISQPRSLTLDEWKIEQVEFFRNVGNVKANTVWESKLNPDAKNSIIQSIKTSPPKAARYVVCENVVFVVKYKLNLYILLLLIHFRELRDNFIRDKYEKKVYYQQDPKDPVYPL